MRRTIMTLESIMENYPGWKENKIPIEFMPEMREALISSCDVGCWTKDELEGIKYRERYDFSFLRKSEDPHFWFLDSCSKDVRDTAYKKMKGCNSLKDKKAALFASFAEIQYLPYEWESGESNYHRIHITAKQKLREIVLKHNLKDNELLVVGHALTYCYMWGDGFNDVNLKPKKYKVMKNAEFLEYPLYWPLSKAYELDFIEDKKEEKQELVIDYDEKLSIGIYSNRESITEDCETEFEKTNKSEKIEENKTN